MSRLLGCVVIAIVGACCNEASAQTLAPGQADDAILAIGGVIEHDYFDARVGAEVNESLREGLSEGRFPNLATAQDVVETINHELQFLTHDERLVMAVAGATPAIDNAAPVSGIEHSEILAGNLGYVNVTRFVSDAQGTDALASAMHAVRDADALIVDLRTNDGGAPEAIARMLDYFFSEAGVPLFDAESRRVEHYATSRMLADGNSRRLVYVVLSSTTSSAGRCFARVLQERRRAELLGDPMDTPAVADAQDRHRVGDLFQLNVPSVNITTAQDHQSCTAGRMTPDVPTPASDALRTAQQRALERLLAAGPNAAARDTLERALTALNSR